MSKYANAGELRTAVYFKSLSVTPNARGFQTEVETNVFGQDTKGNDIPIMCKWVNAHGNEVWNAMQLKLRSPATITTRYSPLLDNPTLVIYKETDTAPYEVISIDNVENQNKWMEIKVQRKVAAR